jgi:apolipoprotein D and lipocalin family protein
MRPSYLGLKMGKNKFFNLAILLALFLTTIGACSSISGRPDGAPPIVAMTKIDANNYIGKWYEIARYPNSFEKNCINVTAQYSLLSDNKVGVTNTCIDKATQKARIAKAKASFIDKSEAILAVNFAPFPLPKGNGNYHILYVDENYQMAVVGEPKGKYLWFLARNPKISDQDFETLKNVALKNSYDLKYLETDIQK